MVSEQMNDQTNWNVMSLVFLWRLIMFITRKVVLTHCICLKYMNAKKVVSLIVCDSWLGLVLSTERKLFQEKRVKVSW